MSQTTITTLPDLPLLCIFKHLPLNDLINGVRLVCIRWRNLLPTELNHRRSLVLTYNDNESLYSLQIDKLHCRKLENAVLLENGLPLARLPDLRQLEHDFVRINIALRGPAVMNALPGITQLTLMHSYVSRTTMKAIIRLLNHWSGKLISLKLSLDLHFDNVGPLFDAINRMEFLRHLKLNLTSVSGEIRFPYNPQLEIVSRLSTLCIKTDIHDPDWFFVTLEKFGNPTNLRSICCHNYVDLPKLTKHTKLAHCFTNIYTSVENFDPEETRMMELFCVRFSSLTTLSIEIQPAKIFCLTKCLRKLDSLVTLKLILDNKFPEFVMIDNEIHINRSDYFTRQGWPILFENHPQIGEDFKVLTVKFLKLELSTISHDNFVGLRFHQLFPNLQVLRLIQKCLRCYTCDFKCVTEVRKENQLGNKLANKMSECMRLGRQNFRKCTQLHTIEYNQNPLGYPFRMKLISAQQL